MGANRSRTENWLQSLQQLHQKGGSLELTLPRYLESNEEGTTTISEQGVGSKSIIWRVRILDMDDNSITIEQPSSLGQTFNLEDGIELVGIIAIGQNRWMFHTKNTGKVRYELHTGKAITALRITMPESVERCQRRNFYRVPTVGLELPEVEVYPLLDPLSSAPAEAACRHEMLEAIDRELAGKIEPANTKPVLPQVGPVINSMLMNVGGGGIGVMILPEEAGGLAKHQHFFMRINLPPYLPVPLAVTARLRHTHVDSENRTYAGMAFDFSNSAQHQQFVIDQMCRYVAQVQRAQLRRASTEAA